MTDRTGAEDVVPLVVPDAAGWRSWLDTHEYTSDGVWLMLAKKGVREPTSLTYAEALDEALCSGWIDGQVKRLDERTFRQRFTPRRIRSQWSARNVEHVTRLTAEGRMRPRGLAEVENARADGRWERAYAGPATIEVPDDLVAALAANPAAAATFADLSGQNRYAVVYRLTSLRTDAGRRRAIERFVASLARGETPHPQRGRRSGR